MKIHYLKYYFLLLFGLIYYSIYSQNLVFNGSFEIREMIFQGSTQDYWDCPYLVPDGNNGYNPQLPMAKGWLDPSGIYSYLDSTHFVNEFFSSSDYFHSCCNDPSQIPSWVNGCSVGVPKNYWTVGYQYPRTGEGYIAYAFFGKTTYFDINPSEYIQSKLIAKLEKDTIYKFMFYVNKANRCSYSSDKHGVYLTPNNISISNLFNGIKDSTIILQLINKNGYITDTVNWTKIDGTYKALGNEEYITIGNFNISKENAKYEYHSHYLNWGAYAVDDISLYPVNAAVKTAKCGNDSLICLGNSFRLGKTNVKPEYLDDYLFEWYILGKEDSLISTEEHPLVYPETTTTYILKLTDFKFDKTTDTITVNVIDCAEPTSLLVYPNPTSDIVNFKFNSPIPEQLKIELYDVIGRKIRVTNFQQNYEIKEVQMNLFNLASGMYFYRVVIGNEIKFTGKIVLLR